MRDTQIYKPSGVPIPQVMEIVPPCFKIRFRPTERIQKRQFDREVEKCMALMEVELGFTECIFDPNADNFVEDYAQIFKAYNDVYVKRAKSLLAQKFTFVTPDVDYFKREFEPKEK